MMCVLGTVCRHGVVGAGLNEALTARTVAETSLTPGTLLTDGQCNGWESCGRLTPLLLSILSGSNSTAEGSVHRAVIGALLEVEPILVRCVCAWVLMPCCWAEEGKSKHYCQETADCVQAKTLHDSPFGTGCS
jgi:hypothetical protein